MRKLFFFSDFIFLKGNVAWDQGEDVFLSDVTALGLGRYFAFPVGKVAGNFQFSEKV